MAARWAVAAAAAAAAAAGATAPLLPLDPSLAPLPPPLAPLPLLTLLLLLLRRWRSPWRQRGGAAGRQLAAAAGSNALLLQLAPLVPKCARLTAASAGSSWRRRQEAVGPAQQPGSRLLGAELNGRLRATSLLSLPGARCHVVLPRFACCSQRQRHCLLTTEARMWRPRAHLILHRHRQLPRGHSAAAYCVCLHRRVVMSASVN